ncbi:MAG: extracellular solute-binding protein [Anaerolineae bacterium]|nr:extracellular solute-binding protein [Anaerolineae bacterium]
MKKQKYLICICLICLLTSCLPRPPASDADEPVTITFACEEYEQATYESLAGMFHAQYPNITVQLVVEASSASISTGDITGTAQIADTFVSPDIILDIGAPQDTVLDLMPLTEQDPTFNAGDFYPAALDVFRRQGRLWGLPVSLNLYMIFYDRNVFKENDVAEPEIGWSWQDFVEKATALTRSAGGESTQYGYVDQWAIYALPMLAHQKAQPLVNPNAPLSQARVDRPEIAEALQWYADLTLAHGVMPNPNDNDNDELSQMIYAQRPAMWAEFTYGYSQYRMIKGDIGVVPFPEAGDPATTVFAYGAFISAGTAHPEAAWKWIHFLSQQPPIREEEIPPRKSVGEHSRFWDKLDGKAAEAYHYALDHIIIPPDAVTGALYRAYKAVMTGTPAQQALNEYQPKMLAEIEEAAARADQPPVDITVATPFPTPRPGATTVRFMLPFDADRATYRILAQRFQDANPDIAVELISADNTGQSPADFVDAWAGHFSGDPTGMLPLDAFAETGSVDLSLYPPQTLDALRQQGKLMGIPLQVDAPLLYYNRDLFESQGASVPAADWTPQRFVEKAIALSDGAGVYGFYPDQESYNCDANFIAWLGGKLFDENGMPTFDDATVTQAVGNYVQLLNNGTPATARSNPAKSRFSQSSSGIFTYGAHPGTVDKGNIAMWIHSFSAHNFAPPTDFTIGVAPFLSGGALAPDGSADNLYISTKSANPEAAWAWLSFLSAQPEAVKLLPLNKGIAANPAWEQQVGRETATAWRQILDQDYRLWPPEMKSSIRYLALHWFDQALAEALAGGPVAPALERAQTSAAAFVECCADQDETWAAYIACARQADPQIELPEE